MAKPKKTKAPASSVALDRMAEDINRQAVKLDDARRHLESLSNTIARIEGEIEVKFATITQVADLFTTLRRVLNNASAELAGAASYTQQEIARMSADDYREKVLVPLNMGRRV